MTVATMPKRRRMPGYKLDRARARRRSPSPSEAVVWSHVRHWRPRWRRQALLFGYVVDFYCPQRGIVADIGVYPERAQRNAHLRQHGLRVVEIPVADLFRSRSAVLAMLAGEP